MTWDFIGNGWAIEFLERKVATGSARQSYLITGPDSIGKRTLAVQLAKRLLCQQPDSGPCHQCQSCQQIDGHQHPDIHWLEADQVDGTLKVEAVREMQRQIALAPYQADQRVVLLMRAHELSPSAANALLKTLEEPPEQVVLVLTARSEGALLPTLVSRCEVVSLRPVSQNELIQGLEARLEPDMAKLLGSLAAGLPGAALTLAQNKEALQSREEALELLDQLLQADRIGRFEYVDQLTRGRDLATIRRQALDLLQVWLSVWRDVMLQSHQAAVALTNPDQQARIQRIESSVSPTQAADIVLKLQSVMTGITRNANVQLGMESLMLSLPYL